MLRAQGGLKPMASWTVYKVKSLIGGGAGQSLVKLGTVEAGNYAGALLAAHETFKLEANPALPGGGFAVIAART